MRLGSVVICLRRCCVGGGWCELHNFIVGSEVILGVWLGLLTIRGFIGFVFSIDRNA